MRTLEGICTRTNTATTMIHFKSLKCLMAPLPFSATGVTLHS